MIVCVLLCVLGALLNGEAKILRSRVSVEEGRTLTLRCAFPGSDGSAMQWLTPHGYVTFFNSEKVLKDKRFQLRRSSPNRLVVSISNITGEDEGVYKCLHYSKPVRAKEVNVTVWAAPSKPAIHVAQITEKSSKGEIVLNCSTSGGRPCARITWLVGHTELSGNRKASFRGDDKKCAVSSTLRINDFTHRSAVTCVVRHRSFSMGNSTAIFNFSHLAAATNARRAQSTSQIPPPSEVSTSVINSYQRSTGEYEVATTGGEDTTTESASTSFLEKNVRTETARTGEDKASRAAATRFLGGETLPASDRTTEQKTTITETTTMTVPERITTWETTMTNTGAENITAAPTAFSSETFPAGDNTTRPDVTAETHSDFSDRNATQDLDFVTEINPKKTAGFESARGKSNSTVILILVSLMICVLMVIVHLFLMKLRKAHQAWKKENENSDQTLESNKSKSNHEDAPGPTRNAQVPTNSTPNVSGIKYNSQVSM